MASGNAPEYSYSNINNNNNHQHSSSNQDTSNYLLSEDIPFERSTGFTEVAHRDLQHAAQGQGQGQSSGQQQRGSVRRGTEASYEAAELPDAGTLSIQFYSIWCVFSVVK